MKLHLTLFLAILPISYAFAAPAGIVYDYRADTRQITVFPDKAGTFPMGKTIYIFRNKKEIARAQITMDMFSKAYAKLTQGNPPRAKDMVLSNVSDINKFKKVEIKAISYRDIASRGRAWNVEIAYPGHAPQSRKIQLSHEIPVRTGENTYYTLVPVSDISAIEINWDLTRTRGTGLVLKNKKKIAVTDMLLADISDRIKPPSAARQQQISGTIKLQKASDMLTSDPTSLSAVFTMSEQQALTGSAYFLKFYSNSMFVHSELINSEGKTPLVAKKIDIPLGSFFPGKNALEVQLVPAESISGEFFEKEGAIPVGVAELEISGTQYKHALKISGPIADKSGKLNLVVEKAQSDEKAKE